MAARPLGCHNGCPLRFDRTLANLTDSPSELGSRPANDMAKKKRSSGGKAEASGSNYETLVAVWYAHCLLLGRAASPPFDLSADTQFASVSCQSDAPVDDVNAVTNDGGIVFVQAKRSVDLSSSVTSEFAKVLDQFVRQHQANAASDPAHSWSRPLTPERDRLVLATPSASSSKITRVLPRLLRGLRDREGINSLRQVATNNIEEKVAATTEANLKRSWRQAYGKAPSAPELGALLRLIWVQELDLGSNERDKLQILGDLRAKLLELPNQATSAFSEVFRLMARLRADRSGADRGTLLRLLTNAGIRLLALPDYRRDVAALKRWTTLRLGPAPRFTRLLENDPDLIIERTIWPAFQGAAAAHSFLLVGEPGAGKSGLTYRLAASALADNRDVLFLPVDLLHIETFAELKAELEITHDLAEVLANWPGAQPGC